VLLLVVIVCSASAGSLRRRFKQQALVQVRVRGACTLADRPNETGECKAQAECDEAHGAVWNTVCEPVCETAEHGCCLPSSTPTGDPTDDPLDHNADNDGINEGQTDASALGTDAEELAASNAPAPAEATFGEVMDCAPGDDPAAPAGKCFDSVVSECTGAEMVSNRCPGATSKCCPTPGVVKRKKEVKAIYQISEDLCFPLVKGDFTNSDVGRTETGFITASSFSQNRATSEPGKTRRCHKGLDMYTGGVAANRMTHGRVVAIADGVVKVVMDGFTKCQDGWFFDAAGAGKKVSKKTKAYGVTIHHPSLNLDVTYGELTFSYVGKDDAVTKGQLLGEATVCEMLHFELWGPNTRSAGHWGPADDGMQPCCPTDESTPSYSGLKNPRALLRMLQGKWCDPVEPDGQTIKHASHAT